MAAVALAILVPAALALRQAPSYDEVFTLAQIDRPSLSSYRAACGGGRDTCPAGYYALVWSVGHLGGGLGTLRTLSVIGWAIGALALAATMAERGGGGASVFIAGAGATASGLVGQSMVARPYGLAAGATAVAIWVWSRSLRRPTTGNAIALGVAVLVASTMHAATVSAVVCLALAEVWARRADRARSGRHLVAIASPVVPLLLTATWLRGSIERTVGGPSPASITSVPAFYLSVLRPLLLPLAAATLVVLAGALLRPGLWRRGSRARDGAIGHPSESLRARPPEPFRVLIALLAVLVPLQLVVVTSLAGVAYFHRYAIGGAIGLVLIGAEAVRSIRDPGLRWARVAACVVVAAAVPLAASSASSRESPTHGEVAAVARRTGVERSHQPVLVTDAYLHALLRNRLDGTARDRLALAGPALTIADRPVVDLTRPPKRSAPRVRRLLVTDPRLLESLIAEGRAHVVRRLGEASFAYDRIERRFVGVEVLVAAS